MKKKIYFDVTGINTVNDYYTKKAITKAIAGIPQTKDEVNELIENITESAIDILFRGDTVAVYKSGNTLIRIPKSSVMSFDNAAATKEEPKKKEGFFKRLWRKLTRK